MVQTIEEVKTWLTDNGFAAYTSNFSENEIDGEALLCLTERCLETLIPVMGHRVKFLKLLANLRDKKRTQPSCSGHVPETGDTLETNDCEPANSLEVSRGNDPQANSLPREKKKSKHSLENKRRQRSSRNKRKREEKKLMKRGLIALIQELKQDNESLHKKFNVEIAIKEKYFEMWRESEKEKDRLKTSKLVFNGFHQKLAKEHSSTISSEILKIDPSLLQDVEGIGELGKGRFGTVFLKKFRSSPVAVKYFESCTTSKAVEREALFLKQCCHINLPLIYGMNNTQRPFYIVTQFYGREDLKPVTLRGVIQRESADISVSGVESWLHIIMQLCDGLCYLHDKTVIHNDIKNDNIVIVRGSSGFFSPVLIDFGKACLISEARKKKLSQEEKNRSEPTVSATPKGAAVILNAKLPWPAKIDLPTNFRPEVARALLEKDRGKFTSKMRKSFIARIYEYFARYTLYPTKHQLTEIAQLVVKEYLFLKDTSVGTGYDSWLAQLYEKFRNERKSIRDDPEVVLHSKRKRQNSDLHPVPLKLRRGGINWEPPFPEGEDEVSMERHKEALKTEMRRRAPNWDKVGKSMALTFPDRRRQMNQKVALADLREEYPALFDFKQIIAEFERILGMDTSILASFRANFSQAANQIITLGKAKESKKKCGIAEYLLLLEGDYEDDDPCDNTLGKTDSFLEKRSLIKTDKAFVLIVE
ncbi:uncharacterized protein [Montipora capricornis]|uniref:uncharacterized protein n=1 Tax=Montipora capricornis TaxID=246305 RepID=UPI0035F14840